MIARAGQRRLRARREPRHRRDARADRRGAEPRHSTIEPGTARRAARPARRASRASARVGPRLAQPRRHRLPVGPAAAVGSGRRRARAARPVVADEPVHRRATASSTPTPTRRASSTGSRAPRSGCGATRSTRSAAGTSATSCTSRTSICAGGCGGAGWEVAYEPAGVVDARAGREHGPRGPYRMLARAPPFGVALRPPPVHRRAGRSCCRSRPFTWRCAASWRWPRTPGARPRIRGGPPASLARHGQGLSDEAHARRSPVREALARATLGWYALDGRRRRSRASR